MADMAPEDGSPSITSPPMPFSPWMLSFSPGIGSPFPWLRELKSEDRGVQLIRLLGACANYVAAGSLDSASACLEQTSHLASADGDSMQRIAAYFNEALADRILKGWPALYKALNSTKTSFLADEVLVQRLFFELYPFLKIAYVVTNQAIVEAMRGEKMVHIIDLNAFEPAQWINLLQTLRERPEGPPHLRITGIHEQKEVLERMAVSLTEEAEKLDISFQFNPILSKLEDLDFESLPVKMGEALAVSAVLQLHTLLATDDIMNSSSASKNSNASSFRRILQMKQNRHTLGEWLQKDVANVYTCSPDSALSPLTLPPSPKMDSFLTGIWSHSPKVVVVTEQESNHNGPTLTERVMEALNFYAALFDRMDSPTTRSSIERKKVEKWLFGEEIKNIISCEGTERKERHEKLEKWILRLELARFGKVPLSIHGGHQATSLLGTYGYGGYKVRRDDNGRMLICWHDRPLYSISAWTSSHEKKDWTV